MEFTGDGQRRRAVAWLHLLRFGLRAEIPRPRRPTLRRSGGKKRRRPAPPGMTGVGEATRRGLQGERSGGEGGRVGEGGVEAEVGAVEEGGEFGEAEGEAFG